ncbi:hypothetical protein ACNJU8_21190, partial [Mycobacterium tuberculosis]
MVAAMVPSDPWERLLVAGLSRDFEQMRLDFLRRTMQRDGADAGAGLERWGSDQGGPIRQFRAMVTRAQGALAVTPAMLAQLASQARILL